MQGPFSIGKAGVRGNMRILLIAYEFPPSPSPQSLRWAYLTRELCDHGFEVHVLTPALAALGPVNMTCDPRVNVHRTSPGLVSGCIRFLRNWRRRVSSGELEAGLSEAVQSDAPAPRSSVLNWKGRLLERIQQLAGAHLFPDARGEWRPFAKARLKTLLTSVRPHVVVSSHEPATSLEVGLDAVRAGVPLLADFGDPVLCFYTPARWRERALKLEREVCRRAAHVTVTTAAARALLLERHSIDSNRISVLSQGFDRDAVVNGTDQDLLPQGDLDVLDLLYTGSFYSFRCPTELVDAVVASPFARLSIATSRAPDWLLEAVAMHPGKVRLLGFLPHASAVAAQRATDVLVNIANDDVVHIPGKLYEYLGAGRPILHLGGDDCDEVAQLIRNDRRGLVCANAERSISHALDRLMAIKRQGLWASEFDLDAGSVDKYSWQAIGLQLAHRLVAMGRERS